MRVVVCLVAVVVAACSYSDPDLAQTQFRCGSDGKCPAGQVCKSGICVVSTHDGLACTTTCSAGEQCCDDSINPRRCLPGTDDCLGVAAYCDGKEDCAAGSVCCRAGTTQACELADDCVQAICQDSSDCPSRAPNCCVDPSDPTAPWKYCDTTPC